MVEQSQLAEFPEDWTKALAVVAHPDDMEYGAASAVARWTSQGKTVSYLLVTRGEAGIDAMKPEETAALREAEERNSAQVVGVRDVAFLNYPDGVVEYGLPLRRDIARVIRQNQPEVLITVNFRLTWDSGMLNMADHRSVALAVLDAARDAGNRWIFPDLLKEGHQPWDGVRLVGLNGSPQPTHAVDVTDFLDVGIISLKEHRVYIENLPISFDPESFLRESALATGKRLGCPFAVSFEVITI